MTQVQAHYFTCPVCHNTSYDADDVIEKFCRYCRGDK